jgi:hypothetical protein
MSKELNSIAVDTQPFGWTQLSKVTSNPISKNIDYSEHLYGQPYEPLLRQEESILNGRTQFKEFYFNVAMTFLIAFIVTLLFAYTGQYMDNQRAFYLSGIFLLGTLIYPSYNFF